MIRHKILHSKCRINLNACSWLVQSSKRFRTDYYYSGLSQSRGLVSAIATTPSVSDPTGIPNAKQEEFVGSYLEIRSKVGCFNLHSGEATKRSTDKKSISCCTAGLYGGRRPSECTQCHITDATDLSLDVYPTKKTYSYLFKIISLSKNKTSYHLRIPVQMCRQKLKWINIYGMLYFILFLGTKITIADYGVNITPLIILTKPLVAKSRKYAYSDQPNLEDSELAEATFKLAEKCLQTVPEPYDRDIWKVVLRH
ncbi:6904_t:CDS:2 [Paraglomus occultum]|uniref:6904_t:CDS:1 n=1 Tax=Paraglomus occultum TaxID=144539 RepID=A0A9N8ZUB5_9GLOM|nr:6904_t:CDS:2 [Paraglomus occultum]